MVTFSFALKKILIFPKHDVKSMAQRVASQPVLIAWGVLIIVLEKAHACPQVLKQNNLGHWLVTNHCNMHFM
jgi:hypothetical protein